jgi:tRNA pseudouridine55 synthase
MKRQSSGLNMLVGVNKPVGMTSHDVVARARRALGESRVGHAGTLDPLASGVMVLGVGQATRLLSMATAHDKRYLARVVFGCETATDDAEGAPTVQAPAPARALDEAWAAGQMGLLLAMTSQVPPAYSAVQVGGVRAYAAAREGAPLELAERAIAVYGAQLVAVGEEGGAPYWDVALHVSKGTYVRSLARDLGRALGSAAHVGALMRTASGPVALTSCCDLDALAAGGPDALRPLDPVGVLGFARVQVSPDDVRALRDGKRLSAPRTDGGRALRFDDGKQVAFVYDGHLYAVGRKEAAALVPTAVFPSGVAGVAR